MALVVMAVTTSYGSTIRKGEVVNVPDEVAERWVNNKIAKYAEPESVQQDPEDGETEEMVIDYEGEYKAAELQAMAKEREIPDWSSMKKKDLVKALQQDDKRRQQNGE